jgi:hypothetical protein
MSKKTAAKKPAPQHAAVLHCECGWKGLHACPDCHKPHAPARVFISLSCGNIQAFAVDGPVQVHIADWDHLNECDPKELLERSKAKFRHLPDSGGKSEVDRCIAEARAQVLQKVAEATSKKRYRMQLSSVGNPDFGQYAPVSEPEWAFGDTLGEMRKAAEAYRSKWELGGGNWTVPVVLEGEKVVGHFSYNMRFWEGKFDSKNWEKAKEIIIPKETA